MLASVLSQRKDIVGARKVLHIARKNAKGHQKAIVAVARKMIVSIYNVLTGNELYDGHREDVRIRKLKGWKGYRNNRLLCVTRSQRWRAGNYA